MTARTNTNEEIEIIGNPITGNNPDTIIPVKNILSSNYPNPFNPSTTIRFGLNKEEMVNITIYNVRGQKVKTLINHTIPAGQHQITWDGKDDNSRFVGSGVYFYKMETKDYRKVRKALLLKWESDGVHPA